MNWGELCHSRDGAVAMRAWCDERLVLFAVMEILSKSRMATE